MKYLLVSDTHGERQRLFEVLLKHDDIDGIFHMGDVGFELDGLPRMNIVCGNHDQARYPRERILQLQDITVYQVHGDRFEWALMERMRQDENLWKNWDECMQILYEEIFNLAKKKNYELVLFGHTHTACCFVKDGITICNPGSLCFSHDGRNPSYAILEINNHKLHIQHYFLDNY